MLRTLSSNDRRALMLGAAILGPALVFSLVVRPLVQHRSDAVDELRVQQGLLVRERALLQLASDDPLMIVKERTALLRELGRLFPSDAATAQAELNAYVAQVASLSHARILNAETSAVADSGSVAVIRMNVQAQGDLESVLSFVRRLEAGPKLLRVTQLNLQSQSGAGAQGTAPLTLFATLCAYAPAAEKSHAPDNGNRPAAPRTVALANAHSSASEGP